MTGRILLMLALGLVLVAQPVTAAPAVPPACLATSPALAPEFLALREALGERMGAPAACPEGVDDPDAGVVQSTTTGLAVWRRSTRMATFGDGFRHWALTPRGLVGWSGSAADPPALIAADPEDVGAPWPCRVENPVCGTVPWWDEWDAAAQGEPTTLPEIAPGVVLDDRYREALALLDRWPEGHRLLREASASGVPIETADLSDERAFGAFDGHRVLVDAPVASAPTWVLAGLLAHELQHAADLRDGVWVGLSTRACQMREERAFQTERTYMSWLAWADRPGGLPAPEHWRGAPAENRRLIAAMYWIATDGDPEQVVLDAYEDNCRR